MKNRMLMSIIAFMICAGLFAQEPVQQPQRPDKTKVKTQSQPMDSVGKPERTRVQEQPAGMTQTQTEYKNRGQMTSAQKHARNEERKAHKRQQKELKRQQREARNQEAAREREMNMERAKPAPGGPEARPAPPQRKGSGNTKGGGKGGRR